MREIEWEPCPLPVVPAPDLHRRFQRETGRPTGTIHYFAGNDWAADVVIRLSVEINTHVVLEPELAELLSLVVSQEASCRYCFAATRTLLRVMGMPESRIARLEHSLLTADLSDRERAALDFARRMARSDPPVTTGDLTALRRAGFADAEIREIVAATALNVIFNRISTLCALPPGGMEALPDRWYVRLLRPLVAFQMRRIRRRSPPVHLHGAERQGPYAAALLALDGVPAARALHACLAGMWQSPVLPRRTKALIFAVVARALGCLHSEAEAVRLLREEGLTADEIEGILSHLASPALGRVERAVVPFARDTVWYQPARIQRRARELLDVISREEFLETVTAVALANALCRFGFAWVATE